MKTMLKKLAPFAIASLLAVGPARAQIDPGLLNAHVVYEGDVEVGQLVRIETGVGRSTEHRVLYPTYVAPSSANGLALDIRPSGPTYRGLDDFLARVPFTEGSRYVRTESSAYTSATRPQR